MTNPNLQINRRALFTKWVTAFFAATAVSLLMGSVASAQVVVTNPGNTTPGLAATYTSLALAITDLNAQTAISGPVTITLTGNEIAPAGGYSITAIPSGASATNNIVIQGSSSTITASAALTSGALNDAIFKLIGADFITIQNFTMLENAANTVTALATNNMTEWGVALLYASTTNGAQNATIQNCTITLNRTYPNTFGIYSNSTHSATAPTTSASATTTAGGNSGMKVYGNTISNVNMGIVVVGPTAAADANTGIDIGGAGGGQANSITNFGTSNVISAYANVSVTVNGILVRNSNGFNISFNTVTSSVGGTTAGTLNGIQVPAASAIPTTTFTNTINSNNISLQSAVTAGSIVGISYSPGSASATSILNINSNNFNTFGHTVAGASGTITFITDASTNLTTSISSNTFTNMTVNTPGSVTFISNSITVPAGGSQTINSNSIVTAFNKTGAGGTVTGITTGGSSTTVTSNWKTNNFSNITVTGATAVTFINQTDGGTVNHTITGNTFSNITGGTSAIIGINSSFGGGNSGNGNLVSGNTITNISSAGAISAITIGSSGTTSTVTSNTIGTLSSTGASLVLGITSAAPTSCTISKNKVYDLSNNNATGTVTGIAVTAGTLHSVFNNLIGDLRATAANAANPLIGLNITGGTTVNAYFNT
ncbi:MAG: beta strand repeat-containing protein, partial [Limisphaerales bacterium]